MQFRLVDADVRQGSAAERQVIFGSVVPFGTRRQARVDVLFVLSRTKRPVGVGRYDTRTGIGTPVENALTRKAQEFRSPPFGPDWVLVVEDADAGFAPPGLV